MRGAEATPAQAVASGGTLAAWQGASLKPGGDNPVRASERCGRNRALHPSERRRTARRACRSLCELRLQPIQTWAVLSRCPTPRVRPMPDARGTPNGRATIARACPHAGVAAPDPKFGLTARPGLIAEGGGGAGRIRKSASRRPSGGAPTVTAHPREPDHRWSGAACCLRRRCVRPRVATWRGSPPRGAQGTTWRRRGG